MTIKDIVLSMPAMGINDWLGISKKYNLTRAQEQILLDCADYYNKIEINHNADFIKSINI